MGIGGYSESLASVLLESWTSEGQLFRVINIGGNYPTIDVYFETEKEGRTYIALFQVKSTEQKITRNAKLKVQISKKKLNKLSRIIAPTYILGVEMNKENPPISKGFIMGAFGHFANGFNTMETLFPINPDNLLKL